jgi:hypothetical protein
MSAAAQPVAGGTPLGTLVEYYRWPAVRARIAEYCGGSASDARSFTATALAAFGGVHQLREAEGAPVGLPLSAWPSILEDGVDVCRSLSDRTGTLLVFDIDYVNHDDLAEPYRDPQQTFRRLEPVYSATGDILASYAIRPLVLVTGRGYHVVMKAVWGSPLEAALTDIGSAPTAGPRAPRPAERRTHDGAGRLLEHLAHQVVRAVAGRTEVPVSVLDVPPRGGGPFICLDVTAYGDPLAVRNTRCAFSLNQKARAQGLDVRPDVVSVLPRAREPLADLLRARADLGLAAGRARGADGVIPLVSDARRWIRAYRGSTLARFHRFFDEAAPPSEPRAFDDVDLDALPACVAFPLRMPNDALLTPGWLRSVALILWAMGWHPQAAVGLVVSRYSGEHGWGSYWDRYDREERASFYVRLCCGAIAGGIENWDTFSCDEQRSRGLCPAPPSGCGVELGRIGLRRGTP